MTNPDPHIPDPPEDPRRADHYRHPDCVEIVYLVEDGHVLTLREYDSVEAFERTVADARYLGLHEGVEALPDPATFADEDDTSEDG
ncbi:hypothetical protein ACFQPA_21405 [Halomarina halobia]|uniref:Uncharacterized protein n=1 Tax=Halomarina halobia TaxID=3033386 RepID=A0ABD6AF72_9EURY|nr:hypothetical protein [Halomarina sp. PSR21]